ncbi:hypothetical protein BAE44_0001234 [Dichanthelium oligosanthes]|uniref:AAA+ ATPase domain-containing protein n=1 Tax=Dichanthelium oligosanthes TaxID=888268 RepID=A0A1E5WK35_9POAL|nr:hypothetical protein BAE44_0001234 [Dichanthelium oligosanthes]
MPKAVGFYHCTQDPRRYKLHPHTPKANAEGCAGAGAGLHLVGIDVPVKKLLRWLVMSTDKSLKVVSIVGPAGVGKTTLAMELCRRLWGQSGGGHYYFHCGATARATRGADRNKLLLQQILEEIRAPQQWASKHSRTRTYLERLHGKDQVIIDEAPGKPDPNIAVNYGPKSTTLMEHLTRDIRERLEGKRYFILIDDLWEASDWEQIKGAFPNDNNSYGSQILVTTRVGSVARLCCSDYGGLVHEMKPLDALDSEKLLHTRAFGSMDGHQPDKTTSKFLTSKSTEMGFAFNSSTLIEGTPPANISSSKTGIPRWLAHHHPDRKRAPAADQGATQFKDIGLPNHLTKLEKFKITAGRFVSVPQWIESLQHLAFLQITVCKLEPRDLKILADLLRLRCLGLDLEFIPTEEVVIGRAMLRLAYLELEVISASARERAVPSGLRNLQSLTEVVLHYNQKCTKHDVQKFDETEWATKIHSEARHGDTPEEFLLKKDKECNCSAQGKISTIKSCSLTIDVMG